MGYRIHRAPLRLLTMVLCLGAAVSGCGPASQPRDRAAAPKPDRTAARLPPNAGPQNSPAHWAKDRKGNPIPVIDARSIKHSAVPVGSASQYQNIPSDKPVIHRTQAGTPEADGWCVAESTRGSFSVSVPGRFTDSMVKSGTTTGGIGVLHTIVHRTADGTEFNVLETEVIGLRPQAHADLVQQMIVGYEKKGVTVSRKEVVFEGVRADRLGLNAKGVGAEIVLVNLGDRNYMLGVQWRPPARAGLPEDIERFFASFEVKPKASSD